MKTDNEKICGSTDCIANINGKCVADKCQAYLILVKVYSFALIHPALGARRCSIYLWIGMRT